MAQSNVLEITDANFETEVLASDRPFLLDFTATWCGPCRALMPVVEKIAEDHVGKVRVGKLDIDASPAVAARLGIRGAPTVIVFANGREAGRRLGMTSERSLVALLGL